MKSIKKIINILMMVTISVGLGRVYERFKQEKKLDLQEEVAKKLNCFYQLLIQWLVLKRDGKNLAEYFKYNGYDNIAIYGMRELGEQLLLELLKTDIHVKYIIDKNAEEIVCDLPKFKPEDMLPQVDAIIVTAIYYYPDIQETLEQKVKCPIISLEDVIYGLI